MHITVPYKAALLFFTFFLHECGRAGNWTKYHAHYWSRDGIVQDTVKKLNISESINVIGVLAYYGVDSKMISGELYIPVSILKDNEFMLNVSSKSTDSIWLKEHLQR